MWTSFECALWEDFGDESNGGFAGRGVEDNEQSAARIETLREGLEQENSEYVQCWGAVGAIKCKDFDI